MHRIIYIVFRVALSVKKIYLFEVVENCSTSFNWFSFVTFAFQRVIYELHDAFIHLLRLFIDQMAIANN